MCADRQWLAGAILGTLILPGAAAPAAEMATAKPVPASEIRLRQDVTFLASDECEGRGPTTQGITRAAEYIAAEFRKAGLRPGGAQGSYFQPFTIPAAVLEEPAQLTLTGPRGQKLELKQGQQFWPMGLAGAGKDSGGLVFAGYGITSNRANYDDYADLDVTDKVVVLLRSWPRQGKADTPRALVDAAAFVTKINNAENHHAAAVLIVNDRETARDGDSLLDFNFTALDHTTARLPAFHVHRSVLESLLSGGAKELEGIEAAIDRDLKPQSRPLEGWTASFEVKMRHDKIPLRNIVGVLEGSGPLAKETVIVGAHYDHLGHGSRSSLARIKKMAIHHGADDNASGSSAIMELARRFAAQKDRQGRRLVFMAFSGEELGLLGSDYYCKHPLFPLSDTVAMYNLDMVGRLRPDPGSGKDRLLTEGCGTAKPFAELLDRLAKRYDLKMVNKPGGSGMSDHDSFARKKVPVLFVWTDYHADYHRPSDTADKINVPGMRKIVDLSEEAICLLSTMERPAYVEVKGSHPIGLSMENMPRLGIRPDYADDGEGVLLAGISAGMPAAKAGLREGDRILVLAGKPVKNVSAYMQILMGQKKGDTVEAVILRDKKRQTIKVTLE